MAHNKLYRNFIILQEDERGYSHSNEKTLSGYAKVEAKGDKCKVSFYAQNLRPEDNYSMVLICCKRDLKQLIDIGPLAINEVGKGDTSREYYVNNIAGLGISYEKISGAAICRLKENEPEFIMHGFMNGEDSADNWRKFKFVRTDSKKYINKVDEELKKKDIGTSSLTNKASISQASNIETNYAKSANEIVERKNEESNFHSKENIQLENDTVKVESKYENRIPENNQNITETIGTLDEERHKNKECKKHDKFDELDKYENCNKCGEHEKYNKYDKFDKHENNDEIEEVISKLAKKLDTCENMIDLNMGHITEDIEVYGFIKYKKGYNCKWKKFKLEKKYRDESQEFNYFPGSYKRIEENFKLDKLNDINKIGRLDMIDFDEYENNIQQGNLGTPTGQTNLGTMGQTGMGNGNQPGTGTMEQPELSKMTPISSGTMSQTGMGNGNQPGATTMEQPELSKMTPISSGTMTQTGMGTQPQPGTTTMGQPNLGNMAPTGPSISPQTPSSQCFNIKGEIGRYFEKLVEGFQPYSGNLTDINHCKWYKVNVNSIDDLSDDSNYNQYTLAYYPMLNYYPYISKIGHFLLGYKCNRNGDMQYIIYAIPGSKEKNDQPYGGRTGFVTWTNDSRNGRGYWLMFYDFKNSTIVIPTK